MTAWHCLADVPLDEVKILFGYDRMTWQQELDVVRMQRFGPDGALICLSAPVVETIAAGDALRLRSGEDVAAVGYTTPRVHIQTTRSCTVLQFGAGLARLACHVPSGGSGGPVLAGGQVAAVVSGTTGGETIAIALPDDPAKACPPEED